MKLNQKLIKQLRNGEIAVENSGTLEQLKEVLKAAFPEDGRLPSGDCKYYSRLVNTDGWTGLSFHYKSKPPFKISDFYQTELFTGWAKDDKFPSWMAYFKDDIPTFGISGDGSKWYKQLRGRKYSQDRDNRPATHEEVEKNLIQEAIKRGYKKGVTCLFGKDKEKRTIDGDNIKYLIGVDGIGFLCMDMDVIFNEENGQWAEIVEQPKPKTNPIHYTVDGTTYSLNYQELKAEYNKVASYSDEGFMKNLPQIAHLACIISFFKGLGTQATIGDKGIIHELIHLMTDPEEPTNDLQEIREKFNKLIQLV